jgi:hypothetical protein
MRLWTFWIMADSTRCFALRRAPCVLDWEPESHKIQPLAVLYIPKASAHKRAANGQGVTACTFSKLCTSILPHEIRVASFWRYATRTQTRRSSHRRKDAPLLRPARSAASQVRAIPEPPNSTNYSTHHVERISAYLQQNKRLVPSPSDTLFQGRAPSVDARQGSRRHAKRAPSVHGKWSLGDRARSGDQASLGDQAASR